MVDYEKLKSVVRGKVKKLEVQYAHRYVTDSYYYKGLTFLGIPISKIAKAVVPKKVNKYIPIKDRHKMWDDGTLLEKVAKRIQDNQQMCGYKVSGSVSYGVNNIVKSAYIKEGYLENQKERGEAVRDWRNFLEEYRNDLDSVESGILLGIEGNYVDALQRFEDKWKKKLGDKYAGLKPLL